MLNSINDAFIQSLRAILPPQVFCEIADRYLEEPRGRWRGQAGLVLAPRTTAEVSQILRAANDARVPVVTYGGGTGLVGGQVMPAGPVPLVLSLERMTALRDVLPEENVIVVEAGMILSDLQQAALKAGRLFPLSIAAQGSARIGGNLATNAGGVNVLRYGNSRDLCLGLEVVLADGQVLNGLSRLRKDNTGYDLRNLMIGSEGTLGVITAAALKLAPIPATGGTALLAVRDPAAALELLALARAQVGETISAFELIYRQGQEFLAQVLPQVRLPFDPIPEWVVLIELGMGKDQDPALALETLFEAAMEQGLVEDGLIAQSEAQREAFWTVREMMPEANRLVGAVASNDISLPLGQIAAFIERMGEEIAAFGPYRINAFGHLGDGNLHYNVFPPEGEHRDAHTAFGRKITGLLYQRVHEMGGSISAEHGIGRLKVSLLEQYGDPVKLALMRQIKTAFDPNGILNPGVILRG